MNLYDVNLTRRWPVLRSQPRHIFCSYGDTSDYLLSSAKMSPLLRNLLTFSEWDILCITVHVAVIILSIF